jgi:hypothetical protein
LTPTELLHVFCFLRFPGCIPRFFFCFLQGISDCHDTVAAGDRSKLQALSSLGLKPQGFGFLLRDASADTTAFSSEVTLEVTFFRSQVLKCGVPDSPAT